ERAAQRFVAVGQQLDHYGAHRLACLEFDRTVECRMDSDTRDGRDLGGLGGTHDLRIETWHHTTEVVRLSGACEPIPRGGVAPSRRWRAMGQPLDAETTSRVDVRPELAAVISKVCDERVADRAAAGARHGEDVRIDVSNDDHRAVSGGYPFRRHHILAGHAR